MKNCFYCEKATVSRLLLLTVALFLVTLSNTVGTVSIEKTSEVYDYQDNSDGSFEYYSYMNRDFNVTATANTYAKGDSNYELQYNGKNVNGTDTTTTYKYIQEC